eukprot:scaffold61357_cov75-Phaeocystis_antarctica.AAC.2
MSYRAPDEPRPHLQPEGGVKLNGRPSSDVTKGFERLYESVTNTVRYWVCESVQGAQPTRASPPTSRAAVPPGACGGGAVCARARAAGRPPAPGVVCMHWALTYFS